MADTKILNNDTVLFQGAINANGTIIVENSNGQNIGHIQIGTVDNDAGNGYVRGNILFGRDVDQVTWNSTNDEWTFLQGGSSDFSLILHDAGGLRIFTADGISTTATYTNTQFREAHQSLTIGLGGDVSVSRGALSVSGNITTTADLTANDGFFSGNVNISSNYPRINLNDLNSEDDWSIINADGTLEFYNQDDDVRALQIDSDNNSTFNGSVTANSIIKSGGTSSQFLKADGSVDGSAFYTETESDARYGRKIFGDNWGNTPEAKYIKIEVPFLGGTGGSDMYFFDVYGFRDYGVMDSQLHYRVYIHARSGSSTTNQFSMDVKGVNVAAGEEFVFSYKTIASSPTEVYITVGEDYSGIQINSIPLDQGILNSVADLTITSSTTAPTGTTTIIPAIYLSTTDSISTSQLTGTINADTVDGLHASSFLRTDTDSWTTGRMGIGVSYNSDYQLNMKFDNTNADDDYHFAQRIDGNFSGADNTTADREQGGIYLDIDSSADGDASNEHRLYGIYSDVKYTGFSDVVNSAYFRAESNNSTEKTSVLYAVHANAVHDSGVNGGVSQMIANYGVASVEDAGDVDNTYAGFFLTKANTTRTENVGTLTGTRSEVQFDAPVALTIGNVYGVQSIIDNNEGTLPSGTNSYLFYGEYQGTRHATNAWGLYVQGDKHYLEGSVGIGTTTPSQKLTVAGSINLLNVSTSIPTAAITHYTNNYLYIKGGSSGAAMGNSSFGSAFYAPSDNTLQFVAGTSERMRIDNNGNVGIGTTSPNGSRFHVHQPTNLGGTANDTLLLRSLSNTGGSGGNNVYVTEWALRRATGTNWSTWKYHNGIYVDGSYQTPTTNTRVFWERDPYSQFQYFGSSSNYTLTIDSANDRIGIGTTSPSHKLHVNGDIRQTKIVIRDDSIERYDNTSDSAAIQFNYVGYNSTNSYFRDVNVWNGKSGLVAQFDGSANSFYVPNGQVGIGTTSPSEKLHVSGTARADSLLIAPGGQGGEFLKKFVWSHSNSSTDGTTWRKVCDVDLPIGTYVALSMDIVYYYPSSNFGASSALKKWFYAATFRRSDGTQNSLDDAFLYGADPNRVRIVKTATGAYELQARVNATNQRCIIEYSITANNSSWITPATSIVSGSTTGTVYTASENDNMYISTGGRIYANSGIFNSNVGIGTTTPQSDLHVIGTGTQAAPSTIRVTGTDGSTAGDARVLIGQTPTGGDMQLLVAGTDSRTDGLTANDQYVIAGQRLNLFSRGNGITYNTGITIGQSGGGAYDSIAFKTAAQNTSPSTTMFISGSGNVGIGTTSPNFKLQVNGDFAAEDNIYLTDAGTVRGKFELNSSDRDDVDIKAVSLGSNMKFFTVDTERMRIDSSGNVGIGTTSLSYKLDVNGEVRSDAYRIDLSATTQRALSSTGTDSLQIADAGVNEIRFKNASGTPLMVNSSGKVGIGTTSPGYKLDVSGTIRATGDVIAFSDARVKENIETIDNALDKVLAMRGVSYNRTDQDDKSKKVGVIAQEIEQVLPEVVTEDGEGMKGVAYGNIVGVLIEAIKEQQKQIDELKAIINGSTK